MTNNFFLFRFNVKLVFNKKSQYQNSITYESQPEVKETCLSCLSTIQVYNLGNYCKKYKLCIKGVRPQISK